MWTTWWAPTNASKWQMGFISAFKGLIFFFVFQRWSDLTYHLIRADFQIMVFPVPFEHLTSFLLISTLQVFYIAIYIHSRYRFAGYKYEMALIEMTQLTCTKKKKRTYR